MTRQTHRPQGLKLCSPSTFGSSSGHVALLDAWICSLWPALCTNPGGSTLLSVTASREQSSLLQPSDDVYFHFLSELRSFLLQKSSLTIYLLPLCGTLLGTLKSLGLTNILLKSIVVESHRLEAEDRKVVRKTESLSDLIFVVGTFHTFMFHT